MKRRRMLSTVAGVFGRLFRPRGSLNDVGGGRSGAAATVEVRPPRASELRITYSPRRDEAPDAGEIVWTWVPFEERDGRGKDRPVLVIGRRDADRVYALKLTSIPQDGDRDHLELGSGPWDAQGRPSWVDLDQVYLVHRLGMRREGAVLDVDRFTRVSAVLSRRYGWQMAIEVPGGDQA